jgi:hypothetical protein
MIRYLCLIVTILTAMGALPLLAVPEAARYGHLTCISCHVSPAGGGLLTSHGRDFASEKLVTSSYFREASPTHGLTDTDDTFLIGGDARWVKQQTKFDSVTEDYFWRMQTDIEAGIHTGPLWVTAAVGSKPAGPQNSTENGEKYVLRSYAARLDLMDEHLMVRGGLFMPRYGLNLSDHSAYIRSSVGLYPDAEQTQIEATYENDDFDVNATLILAVNAPDRKDRAQSGLGANAATLIGHQRVGLSVLATERRDGDVITRRTSAGVFGVATITRRLFAMAEVDHTKRQTDIDGDSTNTDSNAYYSSLTYELFRGFSPYGRVELYQADTSATESQVRRYGLGINLYPRPHLQFDGRYLKVQRHNSSGSQIVLIIHYYL